MAAKLTDLFHEHEQDGVKLDDVDSTKTAAMQYNVEEVEYEYEPQEGVDYFEEEDGVQEFHGFNADDVEDTEVVAMQCKVVVFDDEDEYEPQEGVDYFEVEEDDGQEFGTFDSDEEEVTEISAMQDNNVDEDEYEPQPGIDYNDYEDVDEDAQEFERRDGTEGTGVAAMNHAIEVEGDEGFEEIYSEDLFMSSVAENYDYVYNFGDDGGDDHEDENEISIEPNLKRRKVLAVRDWPDGCGPKVTRTQSLKPVQEECLKEEGDGSSVLGLKTPEFDSFRKAGLGSQVAHLEKNSVSNSLEECIAPDSQKDGQREVVLALPALLYSPWIDSKGRLKKGRCRAC